MVGALEHDDDFSVSAFDGNEPTTLYQLIG